MKLHILLAFFAFACFGGALAQIHCAPASFVATSLHTINFHPYMVLYDSETQLSMYKSLSDSSVRLFDDSKLVTMFFERYDNGSCVKYNNTTAGTDPFGSLATIKPSFSPYSNLDGVGLVGYGRDLENGRARFRVLLSRNECYLHYVYVEAAGRAFVSNYNSAHRTFLPKDRREIEETMATFQASNCPVINIS